MNLFQLSFQLRSTAAVLGMILLAGSAALAQQTYDLKMRFAPGEKWSFDRTSAMSQHGSIQANGGQQIVKSDMTQRRVGTIVVDAVDNGEPSAITVTFDRESSNGGVGNGQQAPAFTLAGKTVHVQRKNGQITSDVGADASPADAEEVNRLIEPDTSLYPKAPVSIDQEWEGDTALTAKQFQLAAGDRATIKCKLMRVQADKLGRQIADVGVTAIVAKKEQGFLDMRITLGGVAHLDLASGHIIASELIGQSTMRGTQNNVVVQVDGTMKIDIQASKVADGKAPVAAVPEANAGGNPAGNVPTRNVPAGAPAEVTSSFSGKYKGTNIDLELQADGAAYTGTMTVGGKAFPINASAQAGKLAGKFEVDGTKFDFTASLDGDTLTLDSDGNKHTLHKLVNPLARPRNPLGQ